MEKLYVQYGCGLSAPEQWVNYDVSPTLRLQKIPGIGSFLRNRSTVKFPVNVRYGDIISGLPVKENSCDGIYCSHTLEHLSLEDCKTALKNTYTILKPGGIFRCIVPDLEYAAKEYLEGIAKEDPAASLYFIGPSTLLGIEKRPRNFKGFLRSFFGNSHHLWMWDRFSLSAEFKNTGFKNVRVCNFNDSNDNMFKLVEDVGRFENAVAIEAIK
jgi:predicted SAM-dependent methyltransferase